MSTAWSFASRCPPASPAPPAPDRRYPGNGVRRIPSGAETTGGSVTSPETGRPASPGPEAAAPETAVPETGASETGAPETGVPQAPAPAAVPFLPEQSREDTDAGWGEYPDRADDRLHRDRPPHWSDL